MIATRIGVIGAGWWSTQHHMPGLVAHDSSELVAIADTDANRLNAAADRYGVSSRFASAEELLADGQVDGVIIAAPHAYHYELARTALERGVHTLVEKPLTLKARHAWELVKISQSRDLHLMVGYTYQFTKSAQQVHDALHSGRIGELLHVAALFSSSVESFLRGRPGDYEGAVPFDVAAPRTDTYSDPALSGGGQGQTQVTHAMGMVLWATGRAVAQVSALMHYNDLPVDLADAIAYRLDNGAIGTMASTGSLRPGQPRQQELRYYGSEGFVLQDIRKGTVDMILNDGTREHFAEASEAAAYPADEPAAAFADLISGSGTNSAPGIPAARTVAFLEAAYQSAETQQTVTIDPTAGPTDRRTA